MASPKETPRYMAVHTVLGGVRGGIAPFLGPVIMNSFSAEAAFGVVIIFMISALIFVNVKKDI